MKWAVCFLGLLALAFGEDCDNGKINGFMQCLQGKIKSEIPKMTPEVVKQKEEAINKCFTSNGCDKPDYDRDIYKDLQPNLDALARLMKTDWDTAPTTIKECVFSDLKDLLKNGINKCLDEQNIPKVNDVPDGVVSFTKQIIFESTDDKEKKFFDKAFIAKTNIVRAFRQCQESKGKDRAKKVWSCYQYFQKKNIFDQMCAHKTSCEKDNLDNTCIVRSKEIEEAICKCGQKSMQDLKNKIEDLHKNPNRDLDFIFQMLYPQHNLDEIMKKAKACYNQSNIKLPGSILLIDKRKESIVGGGQPVQLNKTTIDTIHDISLAMIEDENCHICKDKLDKND